MKYKHKLPHPVENQYGTPQPVKVREAILSAFKAGAEFGRNEAFCHEHSCGPNSEDIDQAARRYIGKGT